MARTPGSTLTDSVPQLAEGLSPALAGRSRVRAGRTTRLAPGRAGDGQGKHRRVIGCWIHAPTRRRRRVTRATHRITAGHCRAMLRASRGEASTSQTAERRTSRTRMGPARPACRRLYTAYIHGITARCGAMTCTLPCSLCCLLDEVRRWLRESSRPVQAGMIHQTPAQRVPALARPSGPGWANPAAAPGRTIRTARVPDHRWWAAWS